jgi:hypothetical protein
MYISDKNNRNNKPILGLAQKILFVIDGFMLFIMAC